MQKENGRSHPRWPRGFSLRGRFVIPVKAPALTGPPHRRAMCSIAFPCVMSRLSNFSRGPEFLFRLHFASISRLNVALIFFAATGLVWALDLPTSSISRQVKHV